MSVGIPMVSGVHPASYATNSGPQNSVLLQCRPLLERAIAMQRAHFQEMKPSYTRDCANDGNIFRIADIGCSSGPNCVSNMQFILDTIAKCYTASDHDKALAVQSFFCDLPSNDFNTLFQLHHAQFPQSSQYGYFPAAVAGTAYGRLFPASSLHLIFSSCCLHWLSQTPLSVTNPNTIEWNKGKIWVDGPKANEATGRAYAHQWQQDLQDFFKHRSEEMVNSGGVMFLLIPCRPDTFSPHQMLKESCFRNLEISWQQLIKEGVVDQNDLDTFNIPMYLPNSKEIMLALSSMPNLKIQSLEVIEEAIGDNYWKQWSHNSSECAMRVNLFYKSFLWNVIEGHVGTSKSEAIFGRFEELLKTSLEKLSHWDSSWVHPLTSYAAVHIFKET